MTRIMQCCLAAAVFGLCLFGGTAQAQDTSPYLMGFWAEGQNDFRIVNPTTKLLTVYAIFYNAWQGFNGTECYKQDVPPNGRWSVEPLGDLEGNFGTAKFFAFPAGTRKFDPNAVIGGFQWKEFANVLDTYRYHLQSNLKAVTVNSSTLREFSMIPPEDHECFEERK